MNQQMIGKLTMTVNIPSYLVTGYIAGSFCGLLPAVIALALRKWQLAVLAMICCAAAGTVLWVFGAIPMAIGFSIAVFLNQSNSSKDKPGS
jgi:hypothetical protein